MLVNMAMLGSGGGHKKLFIILLSSREEEGAVLWVTEFLARMGFMLLSLLFDTSELSNGMYSILKHCSL